RRRKRAISRSATFEDCLSAGVPATSSLSRCFRLRRPAECREPSQKAGEARRAQRDEWLSREPALPLHRAHGIVTDAVDREHRAIGAADQAGQKRHAVLDTAIVMQE